MASGDFVIQVLKEMPVAANPATPDIRAGGSTPGELVNVWDFDAATAEYLDVLCLMRGYGNGGLTFTLVWSASSATTNEVQWGLAIRRIADDAEDIDVSHSYVFNTTDATAPSASGEVSYDDITFTNGADMDSLADGEMFVLRVQRNAADAADDMAGDAELVAVFGKET